MMFPFRGRVIHHLPASAVCLRTPRLSPRPSTADDPADGAIRHLAQAAGADAAVRCVGAVYDGVALHVGVETSTVCAPGFERVYVVTVNRGGTGGSFGAIGAPAIAFDWIAVADATRLIAGRDLASDTAVSLPRRSVHGTATTFRMEVHGDRLPGMGTVPLQYEVAVWARDTIGSAVDWAAACLGDLHRRAPEPSAQRAYAAG